MQRKPAHLAPDAVTLLKSHGFPGNVRELENMLERAMTLADGEVIRAVDIHLQAPAADVVSDIPAHGPRTGLGDLPR